MAMTPPKRANAPPVRPASDPSVDDSHLLHEAQYRRTLLYVLGPPRCPARQVKVGQEEGVVPLVGCHGRGNHQPASFGPWGAWSAVPCEKQEPSERQQGSVIEGSSHPRAVGSPGGGGKSNMESRRSVTGFPLGFRAIPRGGCLKRTTFTQGTTATSSAAVGRLDRSQSSPRR